MLILTRRPDQSIIINNDIYLTIIGIKGNQTRIGITAPREITIYREEIFNIIKTRKTKEQ